MAGAALNLKIKKNKKMGFEFDFDIIKISNLFISNEIKYQDTNFLILLFRVYNLYY